MYPDKCQNCCLHNIAKSFPQTYQHLHGGITLQVLRDFRRIADALERLAASQTRTRELLEERRLSDERLDQLELDRAQFESDCEGLLRKADGKLKAAANAEARERTMQKRSADGLDPFLRSGEEIEATVPEGDAPDGTTKELPPLRLDVAPESPKAYATRMKFS